MAAHISVRLVLPAAILVLSACTECPKDTSRTDSDRQVGRFQIIRAPATGDVIELDTATGKTWALTRYEDGSGVSWVSLDDPR